MEQERLDRAQEVLKEMLVAGVQPDSYTYSMLIFACSMVRNEKKAIEVLPRFQQPVLNINNFEVLNARRCKSYECDLIANDLQDMIGIFSQLCIGSYVVGQSNSVE